MQNIRAQIREMTEYLRECQRTIDNNNETLYEILGNLNIPREDRLDFIREVHADNENIYREMDEIHARISAFTIQNPYLHMVDRRYHRGDDKNL